MSTPPHPAWVRAVPNALTFLRLALAFVLPFVPPSLRLATVVVAALTDFFDGRIARRFAATSDLGRLLDGVADKAFAASCVVTLTLDGTVPLWQGIVVLARDLVVTLLAVGLALARARDGFRHMQVRWPGKVTTFLAFAWFATLLLPASHVVRTVAFALAAAASLVAAADYLARAARLRRRFRRDSSST